MKRLVFSVVGLQTSGGVALGIQLREPATFGRPTVELKISPADPAFQALRGAPAPDGVRQAGRLLFDSLIRDNAELRTHLESALQVHPPERFPVLVELTTGGAETFPWEALCSESGAFLGLDERWAVGRVVETISPLPGTWRLAPPLRVAAVLSCLGVPAAEEWRALYAGTRHSGLPTELLVLTSEESLLEEITTAAPAGVSVEYVPATVHDLGVRLQQFNAHVLHLFCHGISTETSPHLQVAVRTDWLSGAGSSLLVEARDIRAFNPPIEGLPWLVVLNSCETASVTGQQEARSLALDLIYEFGVPAVVGMREPVRSDDATLFTRAFYDQLVPELARILGAGTDAPLDWPRLVVSARERIAEQYEPLAAARGTHKEWTLPVVYTRPSQFVLRGEAAAGGADEPRPGAAPGESTRSITLSIEALSGLRAQVASTGDEVMLADIDNELEALRARLVKR